MERVFYPYTDWECFNSGMWDNVHSSKFTLHLENAISHLSSPDALSLSMASVPKVWPKSSMHHLSDRSSNRRSFIGQSAVFIATGCPEHITRLAWRRISDNDRLVANTIADNVISDWESCIEAKN